MEFGLYGKLLVPLATKVSAMKVKERDCILCIDEMQISAENCFNPNTKRFYGHVTLGDTKEIGNHITVILLRGLDTKWKQIISCDVTSASTKGVDTIVRIHEDLKAMQSLNLKVRAVVSDMGSNNKSMGVEVSRNCRSTFFLNENVKIHIFADAQHLLKNLKSALLKGNIILDKDTMKAEEIPTHIINGTFLTYLWKYDMDNSSGLRYFHHLQKNDVYPDHYSKMKVGGAIRLFSIKTASALECAVVNKILPKEALSTAWFIRLIYTWHSVITSRMRKAFVTKLNKIEKFRFLKNFINIIQKLGIGPGGWKPLNNGLIMSTVSFMNILNELFDEDYKFVLRCRLTQDALEDVFSQIRKRAGKKPNALECKRVMKILILSQFISEINQTNYCNGSDTHLLDVLKYLDKNGKSSAEHPINYDSNHANSNNPPISISDQNNLYYITGSIQNCLIKKDNLCEICLKVLVDNSNSEHLPRVLTEFTNLSRLQFPTRLIFEVVLRCENVFIKMKDEFLQGSFLLEDAVPIILTNCENINIPECCSLKQKIIDDFLITRCMSFTKYKNFNSIFPTAMGSSSFK